MAIGLLCTVISGFSNAAPLSVMRRVIKTKSVQYMPLSLSFCLFLNGLTWLAYALCLKDLYLTITNGVGVSLGVLQLALYSLYRFYGVQSQVIDESDLKVKANGVEMIGERDVKVCSGRVSRTSSCAAGLDFNINIVDLTPKGNNDPMSGKASRTSSNAAGMDLNINFVDLPAKAAMEMCTVVSEQSISRGGSLRKLPTPRAFVIDAHVLLEEFSRNTT